MNYKDLLYFESYNSNFVEDFIPYLETHFSLIDHIKQDTEHYFILQINVDKLFVNDMVKMKDIAEMTLTTMQQICVNQFEELIPIRKMTTKIATESNYVPNIRKARLIFQYDVQNRDPKFLAEFALGLS